MSCDLPRLTACHPPRARIAPRPVCSPARGLFASGRKGTRAQPRCPLVAAENKLAFMSNWHYVAATAKKRIAGAASSTSASPRSERARRWAMNGAKVVRVWLRSVVDAILGRVPGKTSRLDTATRMAMDGDFSCRREPALPRVPAWRKRDDQHLVKPVDPLANIDLLKELICIVNEAQERDAKDERGLYGPPIPEGLSFQRRRPDRL